MADYLDNILIEQNATINETQVYHVQQYPIPNDGVMHQPYIPAVVPISSQPGDSIPGITAQINTQDGAVLVEGDQDVGDDLANAKEQWIQETCNAVMQELVIEANLHDGVAQHEHVSQVSNCEEAIDCCCLAYRHSCSNACTIETKLKDKIHEAGKFGLKGMANAASNLFTQTPLGSLVRELIVYGGFIITLAFFLNTLIELIYDQMDEKDKKDDTYGIIKFCISSICLIFVLYDMFHHFCHYRFTTCKQLKEWSKQRNSRWENDDEIGFVQNEQNPESTKCCETRCKCCFEKRTTIMDITRLLIVEVLFYPSLLLSIFQFSIEYIEKENDAGKVDITTWLSIFFSFLQQLFNVYLARIFILAGTVWSIQKVRNKKRLEGAAFHVVFVLYSTGQMFLQVLMIVAIGTRFHIEYENSTIIANDSEVNNIPSGQLSYMIVFAYFLPAIGIFVFLTVHHYWTQKFLVEVFRDILKILVGKVERQLVFWRGGKKFTCEMSKMVQYNWQLEDAYKQYQQIRCGQKVFYPFTSPVHVILCLVYTMLLFGFGLCFYIHLPSSNGGWIILGVVSVYGAFLNVYALFVAFVYLIIFVVVILISIVLVPVFCVLLRSSNGRSILYKNF